ncbi:hypothetical protein C922_05633 [Plasmodium inui San Antonio 1]|uniref:Uncharacterized protein n=1 Tax=Plasmodium inui San Antonio 1 TaxID=1237626 RepID=W6ZST6_9APIC|nr:hypothetical protein C922_05633 [Plasmodium inui San Antonio 1]EUD63987.1 hypothetical protein C922_05633 [Plasmodium inui San Antonio 1]
MSNLGKPGGEEKRFGEGGPRAGSRPNPQYYEGNFKGKGLRGNKGGEIKGVKSENERKKNRKNQEVRTLTLGGGPRGSTPTRPPGPRPRGDGGRGRKARQGEN